MVTLQSFYLPFFGPVFVFIGFALLVLTALEYRGYDNDVVNYILFVYFSLFLFLIFNVLRGTYNYNDFGSITSMLVMITAMPMMVSLFKKRANKVERALFFVISIHVIFLFFQLLYWLITFEYIDFLELFVGIESRSESRKGIMAMASRVPRFCGLFNEPGTYCVTVMPLVFVYFCMRKKLDVLVILATASCLITMSMFGIVLVILFYLFVFFYSNNKITKVRLLILGGVIFVGFYMIGGVDAVLNRFSSESDYSGLDLRTMMLDFYFSSPEFLFTGVPIDSYPDYFIPNDIGLWFYFIVAYGYVGLLLVLGLLYLIYIKTGRLFLLFVVSLILLTKLKSTYPLFWILMSLLLILEKSKNSKAL